MPNHPAHRASRPALAGFPALVVATCLALPAAAATRYVSPSGSDSNTGASAGAAWATISKANASLQPGDVCIILPGSYSHSISPAQSGSAFARISYVGDLANPSAVTVPGIATARSYITVKGVTTTGGTTLSSGARNDSIAYSRLRSVAFHGAKHSMVARNEIAGYVSFLANGGSGCYNKTTLDPNCAVNSEYDTLRANRIQLGSIRPGDKAFQMRSWTQRCLVDSNRITGTFDRTGTSTVDETHFFIGYHSYFMTFRDNLWQVEAATDPPASNSHWDAWRMRDSTHTFLFERDTVLVGLNSSYPIRFIFTASGDYSPYNGFHRWKDCIYKTTNTFTSQEKLSDCTIENSLFAARDGRALWLPVAENLTLTHSTFYSRGQVAWFEELRGSNNAFTSNIFYSANASSPGNSGGILFFDRNAMSGFRSNHNLFFTPSYNSQPGDRSLIWCCWPNSRPGSGTSWFNATGQDANSVHGSPRLADSSFATLDPRLLPGSLAFGRGEGGTDAGASFAPDLTAPGRVTSLDSLTVSDRSLQLRWSAPGDDGFSGVAAVYDLRWSASPIDDANFASATALLPQPVPAAAGTVQSYVVTDRSPGATYYFALRARDEAGNWSPVSNVLRVTMSLVDTRPPSGVTDLSTGP